MLQAKGWLRSCSRTVSSPQGRLVRRSMYGVAPSTPMDSFSQSPARGSRVHMVPANLRSTRGNKSR